MTTTNNVNDLLFHIFTSPSKQIENQESLNDRLVILQKNKY